MFLNDFTNYLSCLSLSLRTSEAGQKGRTNFSLCRLFDDVCLPFPDVKLGAAPEITETMVKEEAPDTMSDASATAGI